MALNPVRSNKFKKDVARLQSRGKNMEKLKAALLLLIDQKPLPERYKDHALQGDLKGTRDLHIEPDWVLLYRISGSDLELVRTGSHSDLFK